MAPGSASRIRRQIRIGRIQRGAMLATVIDNASRALRDVIATWPARKSRPVI